MATPQRKESAVISMNRNGRPLSRKAIGLLAMACLLWAGRLWASGGDGYDENAFAPEHFVTRSDLVPFAAGNLGVVQGSYWRIYQFLAYRALTGNALSSSEVEALKVSGWKVGAIQGTSGDAYNESENGVAQWKAARKQLPGVADVQFDVLIEAGYGYFTNCPVNALERAVQTLMDRLKLGEQKWARIWLTGQDAVFANCSSPAVATIQKAPRKVALPPSLPSNAPAWLKRDHEYQTAAALFYAGQYDQARSLFQLIAKDSQSPWQSLGGYLAARCLLRKATLLEPLPNQTQAQAQAPRNALLQVVRSELLAAAKTYPPATGLIGWVDVRLQPQQRLSELAVALAAGKLKEDSPRLLSDYLILMDGVSHADMMKSADPMTSWIGAMQAQNDDNANDVLRKMALNLARSRWAAKREVLWLVPLVTHARLNDLSREEIQAAAAVSSKSPAFQALQYHLARLEILGSKLDQADAIVSTMLQRHGDEMSVATRNRWLGMKLLTAKTLDEFMKAGPRAYAEREPGEPIPNEGAAKPDATVLFDGDFDQHLFAHLPLKELKAVRLRLPDAARKSLTERIWVRAVILGDYATADEFADELTNGRDTTRHLYSRFKSAKDPKARQLAAILILVNTPELEAVVIDLNGNQRSWGCGASVLQGEQGSTLGRVVPNFLNKAARDEQLKEQRILQALPVRSAYLAPTLIAWAEQKPVDPEAPKALHFLVASTRLECIGGGVNERPGQPKPQYSRQAFQVLHKNYPKSEWAVKTRYFY